MFELTEQQKQAVRATLQTQGWAIIEELLRSESVDVRLAKHVNRERPYQDIAIETIAKGLASERIERQLKRINGIQPPQEVKPLLKGIA